VSERNESLLQKLNGNDSWKSNELLRSVHNVKLKKRNVVKKNADVKRFVHRS